MVANHIERTALTYFLCDWNANQEYFDYKIIFTRILTVQVIYAYIGKIITVILESIVAFEFFSANRFVYQCNILLSRDNKKHANEISIIIILRHGNLKMQRNELCFVCELFLENV